MPEAQIDAAEARTIAKALPIIKSMGANGQIRKTFVLSVTANSTILDGQLDQVLAAMPSDAKLVLVTGYGPRNLTWIDYSNGKIREFAAQHSDRVIIADWNSTIRQALQTPERSALLRWCSPGGCRSGALRPGADGSYCQGTEVVALRSSFFGAAAHAERQRRGRQNARKHF